MPIPAPEPYRRSNLTQQQRDEQLAAIYGVTVEPLSHEEIERMRRIVQQHDSEKKPMQIYNLNDPPREPYRFQKFPMMLFDHAHSHPGRIVRMVANNEGELEKALENGWNEKPPAYREERVEPLSAAYQAEANRVDAQIQEANKRGPGRPKRSEVA